MWHDPFHSADQRDRAAAVETWLASQANEEPYRAEYRVRRNDGREIWALSTAHLEKDGRGRPVRLIGALQNITHRKAAEAELIATRDAAEEHLPGQYEA